MVQTTQDYLKKNQRNRGVDGGFRDIEVTKFSAGDYVLLTYPNHRPKKLAGMYRGPMVVMVMDHPDLVKVKDLITNRESLVHASRLRPFKHPEDMLVEKIESLVAADLDEFYVEKLSGIQVRARIRKDGNFEFVGVGMSQRTILWWTGRQSRT